MSMLPRVVWSELRYRPWTALLTVGITFCAVASVMFFIGLSEMLSARTRVIQRDLGLNVRFIPAGNRLDRYWLRGYAEGSIDEALIDRLAAQDVANRLVPMLQRTIPWGAGEAILTGIGAERFALGQAMKPVFGGIAENDVAVLGAVAAELAGATEGDTITVLGRELRVARVLAREGTVDDLRVHADLPVVQDLLGMPGKINEIRALECHCDESVSDPEEQLRATLEPLLPGTMMIRHDRMADARRKQRQLADRMATVASPLIVALAAVLVAALLMLNTYQRRREIGLMAAVGRDARFIAAAIACRSLLLGICGGVLASLAAWGTLRWGGEAFVGPGTPAPPWSFRQPLLGVLLGAAIPTVAAFLPIAAATRVDPALTMRGE